MNLAFPMQKFQDWFTQQWVILWGRKINPSEHLWLIGPFGELNGIGEDFIYQLAQKENLIVERNLPEKGILNTIQALHLSEKDLNNLSTEVVDFYEHTSNYKLNFKVNWNPLFLFFGILVNRLFSKRINQLNIPTKNIKKPKVLTNEIIKLIDPETNKIQYTIWLRKFKSSGKVIYSGIYETCNLPSGTTCVKAIFPLPKGNATVIMKPSVGANSELILDSSGEKFGDAGFYLLLNDSKGNFWAQFISSFTDKLTVNASGKYVIAQQTLNLWNIKVANFNYKIEK